MIHFDNITAIFDDGHGRKFPVLQSVTQLIPTNYRTAILCSNREERMHLASLFARTQAPDMGDLVVNARTSPVIGYKNGMTLNASGIENIRFLANLYSLDVDETVAFVNKITKLGPELMRPVKTLRPIGRRKLAYALGLATQFDCFIIFGQIEFGEAYFRKMVRKRLQSKYKTSGLILITTNTDEALKYCEAGFVLEDGTLKPFDPISSAVRYYNSL